MAKKQKTETKTEFVKFDKIGDAVSGTFKGFFESQFGLVMQIDNKFVSINKAQLKNLIKEIYSDLKENKSKIAIIFERSESKKGRKNPLKIFSVYVDKKEIKPAFSLDKANKETINSYFKE